MLVIAEALQHLNQSLAIAREIKHPETEGEAELVLGELAMARHDVDTAEQDFVRSLAVCLAAGDRRGAANAQWALGHIDLVLGRLDEARQRLREALTAFDLFEMRDQWLGCLEDHAALALRQADPALAVGLASASQRLRESARLIRLPQARQHWEELVADLHGACSQEAFDQAWQQAQSWDSAELQRQAMVLTKSQPAPLR